MTKTTISDRVDSTIAEIHKTRERISDDFGGDIQAISDDARKRQEQSARRTVSYADLPNKSVQPSGVPLADL